MSISIQAWADISRCSTEYQGPEKQHLIGVFQDLLENRSTPEESANSASAILEPLIKKDPNDLRNLSVWTILCDAVRHVGSDLAASKRLLNFLKCIGRIQVKDDHGNVMQYDGCHRFWVDLPTFALSFREYGIYIEADEDLDISDWVGQKVSYLNATSFAATCLADSRDFSGMAFYIRECMGGTLEPPYETPELRYRAALYMPAIAAWISIAGQKIYEMCKHEEWALNMEYWNSWVEGLGLVGENSQVDEELRDTALIVQEKMRSIQR
ncbi:hypothetical protein F4804DRAFT_325867 [Jackrogersella minutella]|nr:hypothetical protein F4804DRAFT_325867 [Jackrogersella minutella]